MEEIWKDIEGYEGKYRISSKGRIKSLDRIARRAVNGNKLIKGRVLSPTVNSGGYSIVTLSINGNRENCSIHREVAKAFVPNPQNKPEVNHLDGDKTNNRALNLEWCTRSENAQHAYSNDLINVAKGEQKSDKLTRNDVIEMRNAYRLGCFTPDEMATAYNISKSHFYKIIAKKTWAHV